MDDPGGAARDTDDPGGAARDTDDPGGTARDTDDPGGTARVVVHLGLRSAGSALLVAALLAVLGMHWSRSIPSAGVVLCALLFPPALGVSLLCGLVLFPLARRWRLRPLAQASVIAAGAGLTLLVGVLLASQFLISTKVHGARLAGVLAVVLGLVLQRLLGPRLRSLSPRQLHHLLGLVLLVLGLVAGILDQMLLPRTYFGVHMLMLATALSLLVAATWLWRGPAWPGRLVLSSLVLALIGGAAADSGPIEVGRLLRGSQASQRWLFIGARDHLARLVGQALTSGQVSGVHKKCPTAQAWPQEPLPGWRGPKVLLLLTIDSFRCGFGQVDRPELRDMCPKMTEIAREGRLKLDTHTSYPATGPAFAGLYSGVVDPRQQRARQSLTQVLRRNGYHTDAIATHHMCIPDGATRDDFDEVDESLMPQAAQPDSTTAEEVSDLVLRKLREHDSRPGERLFLAAHYYDPHAPYVEQSGQVLSHDPLHDYAAEVRRTDAAVGRLLRTLSLRADASEIVAVVTADHGEEFGEHGEERHGLGLYEEATRVPVLVWGAGPDHRRLVPDRLPLGLEGLGSLLLEMVTGRTAVPLKEHLLWSAAPLDEQVGVVRDGWKLIYHRTLEYYELYNLRSDPGELRDLSQAAPLELRRLMPSLQCLL